jgi:23S rRNA (uracil1939-C5)-methyltransferase
MTHRNRKQDQAAAAFIVGSRHDVHVTLLDGHPAALATTAEGRKVRVPGGVPGDDLKVEVVARGRTDIWTRIVEVVSPSPGRVTAPCPVVDRCGGCPWQSVTYDTQLSYKMRQLSELLERREALAGTRIHTPIGMTPPLGYRTKIQMPVAGRAGELKLGFYAPRSHRLVPVADCVVQHPEGERIRKAVLKVLNRHKVEPYNEETANGDLRSVLIRVAAGSGQVAVVLVVRSLDALEWELLASELTAVQGLSSVWANENATRGNAVLGDKTVHLGGSRRMVDQFGELTVLQNPIGFFQTNYQGTQALIQIIRSLIPEEGVETLIDLYAGSGLFAFSLADRVRGDIHLIEMHQGAAAAARATLAELGRERTQVHRGRVGEVLPTLVESGQVFDVVIADPPRAGMTPEALEAVGKMAPNHLLYVSCNQRTMIRDLEALVGFGFELVEVHPVDMFPHTPHLETVSYLHK